MGMAAPLYYTADMVRALPDDGNIYEVVHGELLVSPSPRLWHEVVGSRLFVAVHSWLDRHPIGLAIGSRSDLSWGLNDVLISPDLFVVPLDEARRLTRIDQKTALVRAGLEELIARESARRLAALAGRYRIEREP